MDSESINILGKPPVIPTVELLQTDGENRVGFGIAVHHDYRIDDIERFEDAPRRIRQRVKLTSLQSMIDYCLKFSGESSLAFLEEQGMTKEPTLACIIDYHENGEPSWCEHMAGYKFPFSTEWKLWMEGNEKQKGQTDFARFIEDNAPDIVVHEKSASPADMLEAASCIDAKKKVDFKSGINLTSGAVQLRYEETVDGSTRNGQMSIPSEFYIGIPVFKRGPAYIIKVRLRYRITSGQVSFFYSLFRAEKIFDKALEDSVEKFIKDTGLEVISGSPADDAMKI